MAATTIPAHAGATTPPWRRVRAALTAVTGHGAKMVSAARHRYRRPALTIAAFTCLDASAWHTLGAGAGLLALGALLLVWEFLGGDE